MKHTSSPSVLTLLRRQRRTHPDHHPGLVFLRFTTLAFLGRPTFPVAPPAIPVPRATMPALSIGFGALVPPRLCPRGPLDGEKRLGCEMADGNRRKPSPSSPGQRLKSSGGDSHRPKPGCLERIHMGGIEQEGKEVGRSRRKERRQMDMRLGERVVQDEESMDRHVFKGIHLPLRKCDACVHATTMDKGKDPR